MIRVTKLSKPDILANNEQRWTSDFVEALSIGAATGAEVPKRLRERYRHEKIKKALVKEFNDKCAYCECKLTHSQYGDIDHIVPVSRDPTKVFDWDNLLLCCQKCNNKKSDHPQDIDPIVNPLLEDPSEHLFALGPMIIPNKGDAKGRLTIDVLDLRRVELVMQRNRMLELLQPLVNEWVIQPEDGVKKALLAKQLQRYADPDQEFSFAVASYLKATCNL